MHIPARKVIIGDNVILIEGNIEAVTDIEIDFCPQVCNIRTKSRTLIVNGVVCSQAAEDDAGLICHKIACFSDKIHKSLP